MLLTYLKEGRTCGEPRLTAIRMGLITPMFILVVRATLGQLLLGGSVKKSQTAGYSSGFLIQWERTNRKGMDHF